MWTTVAVMPLAAEYTQNGVSVVTGIFSASGASVGALPQPCPIARLSTTRPCLPDAELDRGVHAALVPVPRGLPDAFDGGAVDFGVVLVADRRHGVQVGRDADLAVLRQCPPPPRGYVPVGGYSPVNCGGRLANVAEMPSVRSFDGRNAEFHAAT